MAQRTGAYGLVALLAVVLAASGCGGGSATQATGAARPSPTEGGSSTSRISTAAASPPARHTKQKERIRGKEQAKHGPRIAMPRGAPEPEPTPKQEAETAFVDMSVSSSAIDASGTLSHTYTCDGRDISPPITWQGVPDGTREIAIFVANFAPVEEELFFDWAVAGIAPDTPGVKAGQLPPEAVVGRNSDGRRDYTLCPQGSDGETYVITVFALGKALHPVSGFDAAALRNEVQKVSESAGLLSASYRP